jgi:hypothetical protein
VIDRRRLLDLVDQLRAAVPADLREAQEIIKRRDEVLAQADEESAMRLARADEEVDRRVAESELAKAAEVRAQEIVAAAQRQIEGMMEEARRQADQRSAEGGKLASEQMDEADRYAMEMLRKLEQQLDAFMSSVRSGIHTLDRKPEEPAGVSSWEQRPPPEL